VARVTDPRGPFGDVRARGLKISGVLNEAMNALTTRKPIALTTTAMCSGPFTARIARTQHLHDLRVAGVATAGWRSLGHRVKAGLFKRYGLDVQPESLPDSAAATAALTDGVADVVYTDILMAIQACAHMAALQFVAITPAMDYAYVALAPVIDAKSYAITRFARALRENTTASYVDARELQALIDRFAAEQLIDTAFSAEERISRVAVLSGTR